jgi:hypothetical protein
MADFYTPTDWYWSVATNPGFVWHTGADNAYVVDTDATYLAWVARGNITTTIATETDLWGVFDGYNRSTWQWRAYLDGDFSVDTTLTNPLAEVNILGFDTAGKKLRLPSPRVPGGPPIGAKLLFFNQSLLLSRFASKSFAIYPNSGGSALVPELRPGDYVQLTLYSNTTANGSWIVTTPVEAPAYVSAQTGTSYTVPVGGGGGLVTFTNAAAIAVTLPQATSTQFVDGWHLDFACLASSVGSVTITPTTSTIDGAATLVLSPGQSARIVSDGTNYWSVAKSASGGTPTAITVANEATDTTCFPAFFTAATGDLGPKTNTNLTYNSNTGAFSIGTAAAFTAGTIELGAAADTTISRVSAGVIAVEGVTVLTEGNAEAFVETAIDTLVNLTSIQGFTVTFADAGFDVLSGWDDSAAAHKNFLLADILTEGAPAAGDFVLIYGAEGDFRKVNWNLLPGAGGGISNVVEDVTPELGGDLETNNFDIKFEQYSADAVDAEAIFQKSRNAAIGSHTIVQSGDALGTLRFQGSNGTTFDDAAMILAEVDGTPGASTDMPGRLTFWTTPDASATLAERLRIDQAGRHVIGGVAAITTFTAGAVAPILQTLSTGTAGSSIATARFTAGVGGSFIMLAKSRGTAVADFTIAQDGDTLGTIHWLGSDGVDFATGAAIIAQVDGTPSITAMPSRLVFLTAGAGSETPTERWRISSAGHLLPGASDTYQIGSTTLQIADLFLAEGAVINWDNGDATLTQVGNVLTLAGADFVADTITVNTALLPDANDGAALGASGTAWSDLFLASGAVINFNAGDVTITHSADALTIAGGITVTAELNPTARIIENEVLLTDGATPALDAALGNTFKLVAAGNRTIAVPSNKPASGKVQKIVIMHEASGADRTLALTTGSAGAFRFGTDITALTATTSGLVDYIGCIYNDADDRWDVVSYVKGF